MKNYKSVYHWDVIDRIKEGKLVYLLDKEEQKIFCVNDMLVDKFVEILNLCKENSERFEFWIEVHTEETEE